MRLETRAGPDLLVVWRDGERGLQAEEIGRRVIVAIATLGDSGRSVLV